MEDCACPVIYETLPAAMRPYERFANVDWGVFLGGNPRKPGMESVKGKNKTFSAGYKICCKDNGRRALMDKAAQKELQASVSIL